MFLSLKEIKQGVKEICRLEGVTYKIKDDDIILIDGTPEKIASEEKIYGKLKGIVIGGLFADIYYLLVH